MQLLPQRVELNEFEKIILVNAARFFTSYSSTVHKQLFLEVRRNILIVLRLRIAQYAPSGAIQHAIKYLSDIVVYLVKALPTFVSENNDNYCKLIDQLCQTVKQYNGGLHKQSRRVTNSVKVLLRTLYCFTNHPMLLKHIKSCEMRPIFLKLLNCDEEESKNYSKQLLAVISNDDEIIKDRQEMTSAVVSSMKLSIENEDDVKCLQSSLRGIRGKLKMFPSDSDLFFERIKNSYRRTHLL
jgi:hypothetical protein